MLDYLDVYKVGTTVYLSSRVHSIDPAHEIAVRGLHWSLSLPYTSV